MRMSVFVGGFIQRNKVLQLSTTCTRPGSAVLPRMQSYTSASGGILTDGYSGHDQRVAVEESRGLGRQVSAEVLEEKVLLGLLLAAAFGSHGVYEWGEPISPGFCAGKRNDT